MHDHHGRCGPEGHPGLRVAFICPSRDTCLGRARRRCLQPAAALGRSGMTVDVLDRPPLPRDVDRWDVLVFAGAPRPDLLACMHRATERGAGVVIDADTSWGDEAPPAREALIRQKMVELADVVTTASPAIAALLAQPGLDPVVIGDPVQDLTSETGLRPGRIGRTKGAAKAIVAQGYGRALAAARQALTHARAYPPAEWLRRAPRALAYRLRRRLSRPAMPSTSETNPAALSSGPPPEHAGDVAPAELLSPAALADAWRGVIGRAAQRRGRDAAAGRPEGTPVLVFMDLMQDLDILLPILDRLHADRRFALRVCITDELDARSPRVLRELLHRGIVPEIAARDAVLQSLAPDLGEVAALMTASETSHRAHKVAFTLTTRANAAGIRTYTLQHGLENIGLTYFEVSPDHADPVWFASSRVLTWGPVEALPAEVAPATRSRCLAVGTTKPAEAGGAALPLEAGGRPVVGVFENLHWDRYPDAFRKAFVRDLLDAAASRPGTIFLVKPHHAGRYLSKNGGLLAGAPPNVILADPVSAAWEPHTAGNIIHSVDAVVTTPSTVALDAARVGRPVGVAGYGRDLPVYEPLPILRCGEDWLDFVDAASRAAADLTARAAAFRGRHVIEGDAVGRIAELVLADARQLAGV